MPVLYLIVNRIDITKFDKVEDVVKHLLKYIADNIGSKQFSLVIGA